MECRRKQNACEVEEEAATVKDLEEEPLNESVDCQTTIVISYADLIRMYIDISTREKAGRR